MVQAIGCATVLIVGAGAQLTVALTCGSTLFICWAQLLRSHPAITYDEKPAVKNRQVGGVPGLMLVTLASVMAADGGELPLLVTVNVVTPVAGIPVPGAAVQ